MFMYMKKTHVPMYTAKTSIWALKNADGSGNTVEAQDVSIATYLVNDYKEKLVGPTERQLVSDALKTQGKNYSESVLASMVSVSHKEESRIITLSVRATTPEDAQLIANTWSKIFDTHLSELMSGDKMVVTEDALLPRGISNPLSPIKAGLIGCLMAGLVYAIFFLKFKLDDKINSADDVERYLGLTVLGAIPNRNEVATKGHHYRYFKGNRYYKKVKSLEKTTKNKEDI